MILGIDPGKHGGLVVLDERGQIVASLVMPLDEAGKFLDLPAVVNFLDQVASDVRITYIEQVHAMPGQGVVSMFKFGRVYGALEGVLCALRMPYKRVSPQRWTGSIHEGCDRSMPAKRRSLLMAQHYFPGVDFRASRRHRVPHDGLVDAALIALFGLKYDTQAD